MNILDAQQNISEKLIAILPPTQAEFEAKYILSELLSCSRNQLPLRQYEEFPPELENQLAEICRRRLTYEPLQYIFGRAYFVNLTLKASRAALIPRFETELLVEMAAELAPANAMVLELGCGSGAISLALAQLRGDLKILGVDISDDALELSAFNRTQCNILNVNFLKSDLYNVLPDNIKFDLIVANLPYVTNSEYDLLPMEVRLFEPKLALTAEEEGLEIISRAVTSAPEHLNSAGAMILEIGETQAETVVGFFRRNPRFSNIEAVCDYAGKPRFVRAFFN